MKLWQKNLAAVLTVTVLVLAGMCALLLAEDNRARLEGEKQAAQREFQTALTALENSAALYTRDEQARRQAMIRALQVTASLEGQGVWVLAEENQILFRSQGALPLDMLPQAEDALRCTLYAGKTGPVIACTQRAGAGYSLYALWPAQGLWSEGRVRAGRMGIMLAGTAAALGLVLFLLSQRMFGPLRALEKTARAIAAGEYHRRVSPSGTSDIDALGASFNEMAQSVQAHIAALEQENAQQRRFVANLAHEMKTPMTAMIGYSDLLLEGRVPPDMQGEAYQYIAQQSRRLNELSHKLMALSALAGQDQLSFASLTLEDVFREALVTVGPLAEKKGVTLLPPEGGAAVSGEGGLLTALLTNLLTNACKAAPSGSCIRCLVGRAGEEIFAAVEDEGPGVPEESLPLLTEAFYMVDKSRARRENGAGIGLSLCQEIARLHGGRLCFANLRPGFRAAVYLPENLQIHDNSHTTP